MDIIKIKIGSIDKSFSGRQVFIDAVVDSRRDTSGPTIFRLYDGSGFIDVKSFSRSRKVFPGLKKNDKITARVFLRVSDSQKSGELLDYTPIAEDKLPQFKEYIKSNENEKVKPENSEFTIKSECYERLKDKFIDAVRLIKKSIIESRLIILKHHADCDGYSGAIALEQAILPLIVSEHDAFDAVKFYYKRTPMKKPFYEYLDAIKDLTLNFDSFAKEKPPLVIIVDNGSSEQDLLALQKLRMYGSKIIVVDHHLPAYDEKGKDSNKSLIDGFVDVHINPHLVGFSSDITAGMLAYELSHFLSNSDSMNKINYLPALSGIGDKSSCQEFESYLNIASKDGYSKDYLEKLAQCLDFEAYALGFLEGHSVVQSLLTDKGKQKEIVDLTYPHIKELEEKEMKIIENVVVKEKVSGYNLLILDLDKIDIMSEYPPPGKATGLCFRMFSDNLSNLIVLGVSQNYITIRTSIEKFNMVNIISYIKSNVDYGFVGGGGHPKAGTIKFVPAVKERVLDLIKEYLVNL